MKTVSLLSSVALLAVVVNEASAASIHTTVTPTNIKEQTCPALAVSVSDAGRLKQFEVVVKGKEGHPAQSPHRAAVREHRVGGPTGGEKR
jgi:hypothetical protein